MSMDYMLQNKGFRPIGRPFFLLNHYLILNLVHFGNVQDGYTNVILGTKCYSDNAKQMFC